VNWPFALLVLAGVFAGAFALHNPRDGNMTPGRWILFALAGAALVAAAFTEPLA
jgi:hypothetical protein